MLVGRPLMSIPFVSHVFYLIDVHRSPAGDTIGTSIAPSTTSFFTQAPSRTPFRVHLSCIHKVLSTFFTREFSSDCFNYSQAHWNWIERLLQSVRCKRCEADKRKRNGYIKWICAVLLLNFSHVILEETTSLTTDTDPPAYRAPLSAVLQVQVPDCHLFVKF